MCVCTILSLKVLKTLGNRKFIDSFLSLYFGVFHIFQKELLEIGVRSSFKKKSPPLLVECSGPYGLAVEP